MPVLTSADGEAAAAVAADKRAAESASVARFSDVVRFLFDDDAAAVALVRLVFGTPIGVRLLVDGPATSSSSSSSSSSFSLSYSCKRSVVGDDDVAVCCCDPPRAVSADS
jgi:hypothetical protein